MYRFSYRIPNFVFFQIIAICSFSNTNQTVSVIKTQISTPAVLFEFLVQKSFRLILGIVP